NPIVPGLALALGVLLALKRHEEGGEPGWLALAAGLGLAVPFFKVFLGAHLLLGLAVAALLTRRFRSVAIVAMPSALATAALVLGQGGRPVAIAIAPLDLVSVTRESLGLAPLSSLALLPWSVLWLVASLGLRFLGLPGSWRALRSRDAVSATLGVMALV